MKIALALIGIVPVTQVRAAQFGITYSSSVSAYAGSGAGTPVYGHYDNEISSSDFQKAVSNGTIDYRTDSSSSSAPGSQVSFSIAAQPQYNHRVTIYRGRDASGNNIDPIDVNFISGGQATSYGSATFSALHAYAQVVGAINPRDFIYNYNDQQNNTNDTQEFDNPQSFHGVVNTSITATDTLTATSATLPIGTRVNITITGTLDSRVSDLESQYFYLHDTTAAASCTLDGEGSVFSGRGVGISNDGTQLTDISGHPLTGDSYSTTLPIYIGLPFTITTYLSVSAETLSGYYYPNASSTADAGDTAFFYLDPATSNFSLQSASGTDYSTPVPEPVAMSICSVGATILMGRRKKGL